MKELTLSEAVRIISCSRNFSIYMSDICKVLIEKGADVSRKTIDNMLSNNGINYFDIKEELLDLIISYGRIVLKDGVITQTESYNIKYLKRLFKIKEGDLFKFKHSELKEIIQDQLFKLYWDNSIDDNEALFKAELQALFDLSYEQMSVFVNPLAYEALRSGAKVTDLDTVFPNFHFSNEK